MSGAITAGTLLTVGAIGAGASVGGAALASHAAGQAAKEQSTAAMNAAQLNYKASQDALGFQKQQYATSQQELQPWLQSGQGALSNLNYLMGIGGAPSTPMQGQGTAPGGIAGAYGGPVSGSGIAGARAAGIPGSAGPVSTGMAGVSSGIPGSASPVSTGMGGAPSTSAWDAARSWSDSLPGSASPVNAGMAGAPANGSSLQGIGAVRSGAVPATGMASDGTDGGYGSLMQGWNQQFQAPDNLTEQNDPGYQARLKLGTDTLQHSAAARGNLLTGGTAKALDTYAQDYASNEYGNVYNRAFNQYAQNYNQFQNNQANQYNRLASMAGVGQTAANQLGTLGANAAQNIGNNLIGTAGAIGQQYNNAAAANASGMVGGANAWNSALGGVGGNLSQLLMLKQLGGFGGGSSSSTAGYQGQTS